MLHNLTAPGSTLLFPFFILLQKTPTSIHSAYHLLHKRIPISIHILIHLLSGASVAEWLERAVAVREVSVRVPAEMDKITFVDVGNLLTTSVSAEFSKYSGAIHLIHTIQRQKQHNKAPYK